jgi:hypothetical protein
VTEAEARDLCAQLAREHPDRAENQWFAREGDDGWTVVKVPLPEGLRRQPMTPTIEGKPKPPQADDPRSAHQRNVPGAWG